MFPSLKKRIQILKNIPFFSQFNSLEMGELAALMDSAKYKEHEIIVNEGDIIKNVSVLVTGFAEITQQKKQLKVIGPGDTIGLALNGFFSKTGLRTATITTLSPLVLLVLDVSKLHNFLQNSSLKNAEIVQTSALLLKMELIKRVTLFSPLSPEEIKTLAQSVTQISIPTGIILLRQGEIADNCYLIYSGNLEVVVQDDHTNETRTVATLESPMIFGETSLLTDSPRNASIRTITPCELLCISRQHLQQAIKNSGVAQYASHLVITRSRPKHYSYITAFHREMSDGEKITILKNPVKGSYYRLSRIGWYTWQLLDGKHTLQEITNEVFENFLLFSPEIVTELVMNLVQAGFVEIPTGSDQQYTMAPVDLPWWQKVLKYLPKIMESQYSIRHTDQFVTNLYKKGGYIFCTLPAQIIFLAILIYGIFCFCSLTPVAVTHFKTISLWLFLIYVPLTLISIVLHELAHALTTKKFGFEVLRFGFGWYWLGPMAFADTSDMWLSTRSRRIMVNIAGIYVDMVCAGVACIVGVCANHFPHVAAILWIFALYNYIGVFKNLDPTLLFDGYYILMDILNKPSLRLDTVKWLTEILPTNWYRWESLKAHKKEMLYLVICLIFLGVSVWLTLLLQDSIVGILFPHAQSFYYNYLRWVIPFLVVLFSSLGIWVELREQRIRSRLVSSQT